MVSTIFEMRLILDWTKTFKLSEITKIFPVKRHFVIHLVEKKRIKPKVDAKGRGKSRLYSYRNLIEIGIFLYLTKIDMSHDKASEIMKLMVEFYFDAPIGYKASEGDFLSTAAVPSFDSFIKYVNHLPYFCVLGLLNGDIESFVPDNKFYDRLSFWFDKSDYAFYYIVDVKNIVSYINARI